MLIKEYRIPLPLSVEEYRIAQLYMIQVGRRVISQGYYTVERTLMGLLYNSF
jgi:hypothetical protein